MSRAALISVATLVLSLAVLPGHAAAQSRSCLSSGASAAPVKIASCQYSYQSSPAGNANYFATVTMQFAASRPIAAIRFRCVFEGVAGGARYVVWKNPSPAPSGVATLSLVSPGSVQSPIACGADDGGVFFQ